MLNLINSLGYYKNVTLLKFNLCLPLHLQYAKNRLDADKLVNIPSLLGQKKAYESPVGVLYSSFSRTEECVISEPENLQIQFNYKLNQRDNKLST